jgi:sporulation protein YlmC with PRC-barrel domain
MKVPHKLRTSLLASALAAAFAVPAWAQQPGQTYGAQQPAAQQQQPIQQQTQQPQAQPRQAAEEGRLDVRASRLIGMDVRNPQNENLGSVHDLVLDTQNNRVHYVVLSHGGLFGMGADLFAFPMRSFELAPDLRSLVLNIERAALRDAEGFDRNRWPDLAEGRYWTDVDRRFGQPRVGTPQPQAPAVTPQQPRQDQAIVGQQRQATGQNLRRASEMMRTTVIGSGGERIGNIDDVVIDLRSGQIQYAVVSFDRGWFAQDRQVALPLNQFQHFAGRNELQLGLTREQVAKAPGFDRSRWTTLDDPDFRAQIDRFGTATQPQPAPRTDPMAFGTPPAQQQGQTRRDVAGLDGIQGMQQPGARDGLTFDHLTRSESDRIRRDDLLNIWSEMDRNNDGTVTREEFNQYLQQRSPR